MKPGKNFTTIQQTSSKKQEDSKQEKKKPMEIKLKFNHLQCKNYQ